MTDPVDSKNPIDPTVSREPDSPDNSSLKRITQVATKSLSFFSRTMNAVLNNTAYYLNLASAIDYVSRDGLRLQELSEQMKDTISVVKTAMDDNPAAFKFASPSLRANYDIALMAVKEDGLLLEFADPSLKANPDIVLAAVKQNRLALKHSARELVAISYEDFVKLFKKLGYEGDDKEICLGFSLMQFRSIPDDLIETKFIVELLALLSCKYQDNPDQILRECNQFSYFFEDLERHIRLAASYPNSEILEQINTAQLVSAATLNEKIKMLEEIIRNDDKEALENLASLKKLYKSVRFSHRTFIDILNSLGYKTKYEGVCFGLAMMGIQALLLKDMDSFEKRIRKLSLLIYEHDLENLKEIIEKDFNLLPFFEGVKLYAEAHQDHADLFSVKLEYQRLNIRHVSNLLLPKAPHKNEGLYLIKDYTKDYTLESLKQHLVDLKKEAQINQPLAILAMGSGHALGIGYDRSQDVWFFMDINLMTKTRAKDELELARLMFSGYPIFKDSYPHFSYTETRNIEMMQLEKR